jgi:hypothetical protein
VPVEQSRLADLERHRLAQLEAVVERGLQTFVEVGNALREIRHVDPLHHAEAEA